MPMPRLPRARCLACNKETERAGYKYCSNSCQMLHQYHSYIKDWKSGKIKGLQRLGIVSGHIKKYLREKYNDKCCICGWAEVNPTTRKVPLVADHIDGDWRNNLESNLRLLCPNCDSLTSTYAALNKGRGRKDRVISKRTREARLLIENMPP